MKLRNLFKKQQHKEQQQLNIVNKEQLQYLLSKQQKTFTEPRTIAKLRLEGEAKDKGYQEGIRMYNSHKTKINNQWVNPLTSLNSGWAQNQYSFYNYQTVNYWECMTLMQDPLMNKIINILSNEPLSKGSSLIYDNITEEEQKKIDKVLIKYNENEILKQCLNKSFSMGGCLLYLDFGLNDLQQPLDLKKISMKRFKGFKIIEPINVCAVDVETANPADKDYMEPKKWYVVGLGVCDRSHFLKFSMNEPPYMLKPLSLYFGFPLTLLIKQDIANTNIISQGVAELIGRYRYLFLKTPESNFSTDNVVKFRDRLEAINLLKDNYQLDAITTEEELIQLTTPLGGLVENETFFYQLISAKTNIPYTKLLGTSADGMNATGEGDRKDWYDTLISIQDKIKHNKIVMDGILAGIESGHFIEFTDCIFNNLEEPTKQQEIDIFRGNIEIAKSLIEMGISNKEVLNWLKKNKDLKIDELEIDDEAEGLKDFEEIEDFDNDKIQDNKDNNKK